MKKIFRTKYIVYIVLFCLLGVSVIYFAMSYTGVKIGTTNILDEKPQEITVQQSNGESYEITKETFVNDHDQFLPETGVKIGTTNIVDEKLQEITVQLSNGESYEITKETFVIDHDQFLPEYSVVKYPVIKFSDEAINDRLGEKINRIFYETAMLNYDEELGQKINAEYASYYNIANADEEYISIFYASTRGAGGGVTNSCFGVTVSLADGNEVSLADFMDIDEIGHRLSDYRGTVYVYREDYIDIWLENKEELIEEWLGDERSPLHGWYLYEGRIGFFFSYGLNNQEHFYMEFSGIIDIF